jgi:hypothetical protein
MTWRHASVVLLGIGLVACGRKGDAAQVVTDRPPFLDLCRASNGAMILFDSRLAGGQQTAAFYLVAADRVQRKIASFAHTWNNAVPHRTAEDPPEADHEMTQEGANMDGDRIVSAYRVTMPMKRVQIGGQVGQQMVGNDRLMLRTHDARWEGECTELDPHGEEYSRFLKDASK